MKIKRIYIENYKTYRQLDLNLEVSDKKPIVLIGGANGCGKTTLFDAIYSALYGVKIDGFKEFKELFNAGVQNESGMEGKSIVLEVTFTGVVLGRVTPYRLRRSYMLMGKKVVESNELNMDGNRFVYGSGSTSAQRSTNEEIVNKIVSANLPAELSNYFLFDAMKTSELVKEEQISKLIMKNINSVMGFNKYAQLRSVTSTMLDEKKAERLDNERLRQEYSALTQNKTHLEEDLERYREEYEKCLTYTTEHKEQYERLKEGKNSDDLTRDKLRQLEDSVTLFKKKEKQFRDDSDALAKDLEMKVIMPKLASVVHEEIELILSEKESVKSVRRNILTDEQIDKITRDIVKIIEERYVTMNRVDVKAVADEIKEAQENGTDIQDKFYFLNDTDTETLRRIIEQAYANPYLLLSEQREQLNLEKADMPKRLEQIEEYQRMLSGNDYSIIEAYDANNRRIEELRNKMREKKDEIKKVTEKISKYDYDMPQIPDPQYDMLCKLPDFFKSLSSKLLAAKKTAIERMMKEQLNINLVIYSGVIGRVELSADDSDEICFKIYHVNGNEIYLSQLNAGAKQTVMQVLLKVLYELGDYDPPVMIDTVMGVLDKESREVILEKYFPDLAEQTILLSTDTEITTERDFKKIQAYVAKTYTLHRDKDRQCTTVSEDYFGLQTYEE